MQKPQYSRDAQAILTTKKHWGTIFLEFANKNIKVEPDSANIKLATLSFSTLSYTLGIRYTFEFKKADHFGAFSIATFLSYVNIPDEDIQDYRHILNSAKLTDSFLAFGIKTVFQINDFQIFADFRHVLGSETKIPLKDLRGFSSNIGVTFNAEIFRM
jgi:hypothetical protein